jgi:hypothetical protein
MPGRAVPLPVAVPAGVSMKGELMPTYEFVLRLSRAVTDDEIGALYEAGCDDGSIETGPHGAWADFDREAPDRESAIASAVADVRKVPGLDAELEERPPREWYR